MEDATNTQEKYIRNEMAAQAMVRLVICAFMGLYYLVFGITNHPVYLLFVVYTTVMLVITHLDAPISRLGPLATLIIDNGFTICGLHVTGERGAFLLFFLVHISFAYTVRYGRKYLPVSLGIGCSGVTWLYFASEPWQGHIHFLLSFLFGMPFISVYVFALTKRLKNSEALTRRSNERTTRLLAFLTHDVRAPLQYIGEYAIILERETHSSRGALAIEAIKSMTGFVARMVTQALSEPEDSERHSVALLNGKQKSKVVSMPAWIVGFVEMYREAAESRGAVLQYEFCGHVDSIAVTDLIPVERILANVFSNALRYCEAGIILVSVSRLNSNDGQVRITIKNRSSTPKSKRLVRASGGLTGADNLYGTGVGLAAAKDAAQKIGASFSFSRDGEYYASVLDLAQMPISTVPAGSTLHPVVVFVRTREAFDAISNSLIGIANAYWIRTPKESMDSPFDCTVEAAGIFICDEGETWSEHYERKSVLGGSRVIRTNRNLQNDTIQYDGGYISIPINAMPATLKRAVQLAGSILEGGGEPNIAKVRNDRKLRDLRIIALDDNIVSLSILSEQLRRFGIQVSTVGSLSAAARELSSNCHDVVILDWNIGTSTAEKLLRSLLSDPSKENLRIIVFSAAVISIGNLSSQQKQRIRILTKPAADDLLLETIIDLMDGTTNKEATMFSDFAPAIFNYSAYLDGDSVPVGTDLIKGLLSNFLAEAAESIAILDKLTERDKVARNEVDAHKIASMCYSAGAYALGDHFKALHSDVTSCDAAAPVTLSRKKVDAIRRTFQFTNAHINWFLSSLESF